VAAAGRGPAKKPRIWLSFGCAAVYLALFLGCSQDDEVSRIRQRVQEGVQRAEQRDLAGLLAMTTEGFRAEPGGRDRTATGESIAAAFYYYGRFRILHPEPAVEIIEGGRTASVTVPFLIVRKDRSWPSLDDLYRDPQGWLDWVGENADLYRLVARLTKSERGWLAESARLNSLRTADFSR